MELNITVLCTYGYVFQMYFYKYYAALPLNIRPKICSASKLFVHE